MSYSGLKGATAGYMAYQGYRRNPSYSRASKRTASTSYSGNTGVNRRVRRKRYGGNSFANKVRKLLPAKHFQTLDSTLEQTMTHNTTYVHSPTMNIAKGTDDNDRVGDKIHLEAIKVKFLFHDASTNVNATFAKLIVGYLDTDTFTSTGWQTGGSYSYGNGVSFGVLDIVDPKKFTEVANYTIKLPHLVDGSETAEIIEETLMLKKDFVYETNQVYGKEKNLVFLIVSSVIGGTGGSTITGKGFLTYDLIFKD